MIPTVPYLRPISVWQLSGSLVIVSVVTIITAGCGQSAVSRYPSFASRIALVDKVVVVVDLTFENSTRVDVARAKERGNTLVETAVDAFLYRGYPIDQGELISDEKDPNLKARLLSLVAKMPQSHQTEPDTLLFPDAIPIGATMECSAIFVLRAHMYDPSLVDHAVDVVFSKLLTIGMGDNLFEPKISLMLSIIDTRDGMLLWDDEETREFKEITVESVSQVVSALVGGIPKRP